MPRTARHESISSSDIYHVLVRGINKQNIFLDDEDKQKFIETIKIYKKKYKFSLLAYSIMDNHVHLVLEDNKHNLSDLMHDICCRYAKIFNSKYERKGHLFQNRFKSIAVETQNYLFNLIRYVHKNPEKEQISSVENYKWSSYNEFVNKKKIVDVDYFLNMIDKSREKAIEIFIDFHKQVNHIYPDSEFEFEKLTDSEFIEKVKRICNIDNVQNIQKLNNKEQAKYIKIICKIKGTHIGQIARVLGINKRKIYRLKK